MTLLLPSCLSHVPSWGFTSRCEEGFYQQEVSFGTTEGLEATGKLTMVRVPHGISVGATASQHCTAQQPPKATQSHSWMCIWTLGFIYSSSAPREGVHIHQNHWPQISSALGCSFSLGTVFIYDKYPSWAWAYLFQLTAAPTQRL